MIIKSIKGNKLGQTSYLLIKDDEAILIDCGFDYSVLEEYVEQKKIKLLGVFLTHGHFDHSFGAHEFLKRGINVYSSEYGDKITTTGFDLGRFCGVKFTRFSSSIKLSDNAVVNLGRFSVSALHTPGHTVDGMCYLIEGVLFSGDTLLSGGYGRIDLPTASREEMKSSLKRLLKLDKKMPVCSGHERVQSGIQPYFPDRTIGDYCCSQDIMYLINS